MSTHIKRCTYRLRPGAKAARQLMREWDRARWTWNKSVEVLQKEQRYVTSRDLTLWRSENEWLRVGSSVPQQQAIRDFRSYRKGQKRKRFKSAKKSLPSLNYTRRNFVIRDNQLRLATGITIPVVWHSKLTSTPSSVRVYKDTLGHWYASFVVREEDSTVFPVEGSIGIDWGIKTTAVTTDPEYDLPYQAHMRNAQAELGRMQRVMSRRAPKRGQPASHGYKEAKRRTAKLHKKVARQRKDTAVKWVKKIVDNHDLIAVEDFKPKFLAKSRMAKKAADAGIGQLKRELVERGTRAGRKVVLVPPAYTTQTCSSCGSRAKTALTLKDRVFACHSCGLIEDRDRNAARVILARAGFNPTSADAVRPANPPGLAGTLS